MPGYMFVFTYSHWRWNQSECLCLQCTIWNAKNFRYLLILTAWLKLNCHIMQLRLQLRQALWHYLLQGTCTP